MLALGTDAYGMTIRDEIHSRTGRDLSFGTIYVTLQRLEAKGMVTASMGSPTPERGGRAKRFFKITTDGRRAVRRSQGALTAMTAAWRDARAKS